MKFLFKLEDDKKPPECNAKCASKKGAGYLCTLPSRHSGLHQAYDLSGNLCFEFDNSEVEWC